MLSTTAASAIRHDPKGFMFASTKTGDGFKTENLQRFVFRLAFANLGIRYQPPHNCHHTCAMMRLMSDANSHWVAAQLGHSVVITADAYTRWIIARQRRRN